MRINVLSHTKAALSGTANIPEEDREKKLAVTARWILAQGYGGVPVICDSAEKKSVADYRSLGLSAREAVKGPGSVEYGMKWLQRRRIVIDRRRTPHAYEEFVGYEYEKNKADEWISGYPDRNNHSIDAVRYAMERVMNKYRSNA